MSAAFDIIPSNDDLLKIKLIACIRTLTERHFNANYAFKKDDPNGHQSLKAFASYWEPAHKELKDLTLEQIQELIETKGITKEVDKILLSNSNMF